MGTLGAVESTRDLYDHVAGYYLPIMVGVGAFVTVAIVFVAVRYRRRAGATGPVDRKHESRFEYAYVLVLVCAVVGLVYLTFSTEAREDPVAKHFGLRVRTIASQWHWQFDYPAYGIRDVGVDRGHIPTLTVPADTVVRIDMTSADVIHAFWIPQTDFKRDAFPGRPTSFDLRFTKPGFLRGGGRCSEFCGQFHAEMEFNVNVMPPSAFRAWARANRGRSLDAAA